MLQPLILAMTPAGLIVSAFLVVSLAAGCSTGPASSGRETLTVFAAASLTEAFAEVATAFELTHPDIAVDLNFSGSQRLRVQLEHGARADVFASADDKQIDRAIASGLVLGRAVEFASNTLIVIVYDPAATGPSRADANLASPVTPNAGPVVRALTDLAGKGVKLVLAQPEVPAGGYARTVINNLAEDQDNGPAYAERVMANVVSEEPNVRSVLQKVALGEADAGLVYLSDPRLASDISVISLPESANVVATYPMAVLRDAANLPAAQYFVEFVTSVEGQAILRRHGFGPPRNEPRLRWMRVHHGNPSDQIPNPVQVMPRVTSSGRLLWR